MEQLKGHVIKDRLLIRRHQAEEMFKNTSLVIPETAKEKPFKGTVMQQGSDVTAYDYVGKVVVFGKYAGTELLLEGEEFQIVREEDILFVED